MPLSMYDVLVNTSRERVSICRQKLLNHIGEKYKVLTIYYKSK